MDKDVEVIVQKREKPNENIIELHYNAFSYAYAMHTSSNPDKNTEAVTKAIRFIDCDQEYKTNTSDQRIFSFKKDAMYIFSGINATHHIDIEENNIHWWKFMSLFMDMKPDCMFGELTYYRKRKNDGKLTKEEKEQYKKIKDLVDLEDKVVTKQSEARKEFFKEFHKS